MDTGVTKEYQEILKIKGKLSSSENDPKNLTMIRFHLLAGECCSSMKKI
jgi:hypothetical protein